jgi:hypothetical protein
VDRLELLLLLLLVLLLLLLAPMDGTTAVPAVFWMRGDKTECDLGMSSMEVAPELVVARGVVCACCCCCCCCCVRRTDAAGGCVEDAECALGVCRPEPVVVVVVVVVVGVTGMAFACACCVLVTADTDDALACAAHSDMGAGIDLG